MGFNRHLLGLFVSVLVAIGATAGFAAVDRTPINSSLVVHEWGTFTSVAGSVGQAVSWRHFNGPSDLPCFVNVMKDGPKTWHPDGLPGVPALVRMETPVIYFYAPTGAEQTVDVRVDFNQGLMTEWYPGATTAPTFIPKEVAANISTLEWKGVRISREAPRPYPTEKAPSHYYAARDTDANPVTINGQAEKFLFYRGLAGFRPALAAVATDDRVRVENSGDDIPRVVLFRNRGGRIGYRIATAPRGVTTIDTPALGASFDALAGDLERLLVEQGLFAPEARAMVATWRDSWFEEGTRLFYLLPQSSIDARLPLSITPAPSRIVRAFVGRLELATPAMLSDIERAFRAGNIKALLPYARFIEPFAMRVQAQTNGIDPARVAEMLRLVAASYGDEGGC